MAELSVDVEVEGKGLVCLSCLRLDCEVVVARVCDEDVLSVATLIPRYSNSHLNS